MSSEGCVGKATMSVGMKLGGGPTCLSVTWELPQVVAGSRPPRQAWWSARNGASAPVGLSRCSLDGPFLFCRELAPAKPQALECQPSAHVHEAHILPMVPPCHGSPRATHEVGAQEVG